jgi:hypothetical protein
LRVLVQQLMLLQQQACRAMSAGHLAPLRLLQEYKSYLRLPPCCWW